MYARLPPTSMHAKMVRQKSLGVLRKAYIAHAAVEAAKIAPLGSAALQASFIIRWASGTLSCTFHRSTSCSQTWVCRWVLRITLSGKA